MQLVAQAALLLSVAASSALALRNSSRTAHQAVPPTHSIDTLPSPFPARGGAVDLGFALSGGGIRSAAFTIGVMKGLFDAGYFENVDVISSVSGGGYASFWVFKKFLNGAKPRRQFGAAAFADDAF